ncbi:MAG: hypothetical protein N2039_06070 [Gemmataceae bacterium]|nr:hypothetical protein [Gemmataceae bacterium]
MARRSLFTALFVPALLAAEDRTVPTKIDVAGLENVFRINSNLYSGSGPESDAAFASLAKLGVKTMISVDGAKPNVELARKHGLGYVHVPIGYHGIARDKAILLAKAISERPGPIYIHCHHGKHRGPTAAAIAWLCSDQGCRIADALALLKAAGTDPRYAGLFETVEKFQRPSADELAKAGPLSEAIPPKGIGQAMVAVDHVWDNLNRVRRAGWRAPADHPDIDPPHEALQLLEAFEESLRLPDVKDKPADFHRWLEDCRNAAKELEHLLRKARKHPVDAAQAEKLYQLLNQTCVRCHAKYRDVP